MLHKEQAIGSPNGISASGDLVDLSAAFTKSQVGNNTKDRMNKGVELQCDQHSGPGYDVEWKCWIALERSGSSAEPQPYLSRYELLQ
jgi:hypothetical protein